MPSAKIKTKTIPTCHLIELLQASMEPIFGHFKKELGDWSQAKVLDIRITASYGSVDVQYGVSSIDRIPCAACDRGDHQLGHADLCPNR